MQLRSEAAVVGQPRVQQDEAGGTGDYRRVDRRGGLGCQVAQQRERLQDTAFAGRPEPRLGPRRAVLGGRLGHVRLAALVRGLRRRRCGRGICHGRGDGVGRNRGIGRVREHRAECGHETRPLV